MDDEREIMKRDARPADKKVEMLCFHCRTLFRFPFKLAAREGDQYKIQCPDCWKDVRFER